MKIERNSTCPCGSNKKYKKCCLIKEQISEQQEELEWQAWFAEDCRLGDELLKEYEETLRNNLTNKTYFDSVLIQTTNKE